MSLALYRTYRPSRLDEVIGQDHVTGPLTRALSQGRIHHAYLFSGPRGCGKTSTARILARSLLCERGPTPDPCGECDFCTALAATGPGLVDVIELDAASHGGVDDTRELRERAAFVPALARFKIYIIDEAHMVSKDGFNALLKLIEEPPEHVKFIFATTEVDKVLPTIRSRTFNYSFRLVPVRQLVDNLAGICRAESVGFEPAALALIARASGGSVRDAQSIMGQLIAGAGPEGLTQVVVADQLGVTDDALLDTAIAAVADHDGPALFRTVENVVESGHDVRRFVTDLLHRFRDLLVLHHAGEAATAETLDVSQDRREVLALQAARFGPTELTRYAEIINTGLTQVKGSTSPRLQLEILAARLLVPAVAVDVESTLSRIDVLERRLTVLASAPPATASAAVADGAADDRRVPQVAPVESESVAQSGPAAGPASQSGPAAGPAAGPASQSGSQPVAGSNTPRRGRIAPPPKPRLSSGAGGRQPQATQTAAAEQSPPARHTQPAGQQPAAPQPAGQRSAGQQSAGQQSAGQTAAAQQSPPAVGDQELLARVSHIWTDVLTHVRGRSRVAAASWDGSQPIEVRDGQLIVLVPSEGQERSITASGRDVMVRTILAESFGIDLTVNASHGRPAAAGGSDSGPAGGEVSEVPAPEDQGDYEPSESDPVADSGLSGVALLKDRLGATTIEEIEG